MAKPPKTRKLPRSPQSRPTAQFVTGQYTHCLQDLRALAKKQIDQVVEQPDIADRALQLAFSHKDVHLARRLLDAGAMPRPGRSGNNAFSAALNAMHGIEGALRTAMVGLIDMMIDARPQWVGGDAAASLDQSSPSRWRQSLVEEIGSHPLSDFHPDILEHCLGVPEAVKALIDKGAAWGPRASGNSMERKLQALLIDSPYPLDVLSSLKHVHESTRPNHAPGSDRLARRRRLDWEGVLAINALEKREWFCKFHEPVIGWAGKHLQIDAARLMLAASATQCSPDTWIYHHKDRAMVLDVLSTLAEKLHPRAKNQNHATGCIARIALAVDAHARTQDQAGFGARLENMVMHMVDEMGFAVPDLSEFPAVPEQGRLASFCLSRKMLKSVKPPSERPSPASPAPQRARF